MIPVKGRRHSAEQAVRKLREADKLLAEGAEVEDVCRYLEVSIQTYQRWRAQYKAMRPEGRGAAQAVGEGERQAEADRGYQALDIDMLREVARGNS